MSFLAFTMIGIIAVSVFLLWRERSEQSAVRFFLLVTFIIGPTLVVASETMRG